MTKVRVNPDVLKWARESLNLSIEDAAHKVKQPAEILMSWESGEGFPTYSQLEHLAYNIYKRPLAVFFFPSPPKDLDITSSFRTLPGNYFEKLSPKIIKQLRQANIRLINLYEIFDGVNKNIEKYNNIKYQINHLNVIQSAELLRKEINVTVSKQFLWKDTQQALAIWRRLIENLGIFIFKDAFRDDSISGFCIYDENFPIIVINNTMPKTRQIFTIFHELSHLLFQTSGIDFTDEIPNLNNNSIEKNCNLFAGNFLVPDDLIPMIYNHSSNLKIGIETYSQMLKVSREMIALRLLNNNLINYDYYNDLRGIWINDRKENTPSGGSYYNNIGVYLSSAYTDAVFRKYYDGNISFSQAAEYLNIKESIFLNFENKYLKKQSDYHVYY